MKKLLLLILIISPLYSQDEENKSEEPFDLPETIIYGKDYLTVKSTYKRFPSNTPGLSKTELDSLNSLEKHQSMLLPREELQSTFIDSYNENGFLQAELGRFTSAKADFGTSFDVQDFKLFTLAGLDLSTGHTNNAEYTRFFGELNSEYIADKKFFIFGGSKTNSNLKLDFNRYNNYSVLDPNTRSIFTSEINALSKGSYNGFDFETGIGFNLQGLSDDTLNTNISSLQGLLKIFNPLNKFRLGLHLEVDLRKELEESNNSLYAGGNIGFVNEKFNFKTNLGFQQLSSSIDPRSGLLIQSNLSYKYNSKNSFDLNVNSGLKRTVFQEELFINPYLYLVQDIDHQYDIIDLDIAWNYHPTTKFSLSAFASFKQMNRKLNWTSLDSSFFDANYIDGSVISFDLSTYYNASDKDELRLNFRYQLGTQDSSGKEFTYFPAIMSDISWVRYWMPELKTNFRIDYVGEKFIDLDNQTTIDQYFNVQFYLDYRIFSNFSINARAENLANQDIYQYIFYKQRGVFGSLGVSWNF